MVFFSLTLSVLGVLCSVGLVVALHVLRPDLNPKTRFVSDYAIGPYHSLMLVAFSTCSLGIVMLVVALYHGVSPAGRSWVGLVLLTISGLCINLASYFHDEPQTSSAVLLDTVHDSIAQISLLCLALSAVAWSLRFRKDQRWRALTVPLVVLGVLMCLALVGFILTPQRLMGLSERGLLMLYLLWVFAVQIRLAVLVARPQGRSRPLAASSPGHTGELPMVSRHSPEG
jgi:hypothetical protein